MRPNPPRLCALALLVSLAGPAPAFAATPHQEAVIDASANFSVAYAVWVWEKKCKVMPAASRKEFDDVVTDLLKRLSQAADPKLFNAAVGAGQATANGSSVPGCTDADGLEFTAFGVKLAKEAQAKLKTLPAGYRLTIAP